MKTAPTQQRRNPPSPEAVNMAADYANRTFKDEAEALLALEIAFEDAIRIGAARSKGIARENIETLTT